MPSAKAVVLGLLILCGLLVAGLLLRDAPTPGEHKPLVMFCAAGMRVPVTTIAAQYEEEYGIPVHIQFGGSGSLLSSLQVAEGDIYLAADASYVDIAREKGWADEAIPIASLTGGLGVPKGNPANLAALSDLTTPGLRIGLANPEAASVGKFTQTVLSRHGLWDDLSRRAAVFTPTVTELVNALKLGTIDVAVIWDAVANQYPEVDFVHLPEFDQAPVQITSCILRSTTRPTEALRFCRYLSARDRGLPVLRETGYLTPEGDVWKRTPKLLLYSGAMLRPAIEKTLAEFEAREGVEITPVYNGCGILVSQMKAGEQPDAYFSCDVSFMDQVQESFGEPTTVSGNPMVILVQRGNPRQIQQPADLAAEGLRVGFAHPEKSALGTLTMNFLKRRQLYAPIVDSGNIKVETATGDLLVNQLRAGSLDAIIVYRSNAMANPSTLTDCELVEMGGTDAFATQPFAVGQQSEHAVLLQRLLDRIVSENGKEQFLSLGFRWELDAP